MCFQGSPAVRRILIEAAGPGLVHILAGGRSSGLMQARAEGHTAAVDGILALPGAAALLRGVGAEGRRCSGGPGRAGAPNAHATTPRRAGSKGR